MLIIGLTGGIGSGKSVVAELFSEIGVPIIDADVVSREVVHPGQPALKYIAQQFGEQMLTSEGELNRSALRELVFSSPQNRKALEELLHPLIEKEMLKQACKLKTDYCIFVIPLLLETGQQRLVDRILVVDSDINTRRERVKQRDQVDDQHFNNVISAQCDRDHRLAQADDVITNNSDVSHLKTQVNELHRRYSSLAKRENP